MVSVVGKKAPTSRCAPKVVLILLVVTTTAFGQTTDKARLDELRTKGYDALYNLDYEGARTYFQEIVRLYPDHPAGPQCLAGVLWLQELNRSRYLQATLYSSDSLANGNGQKPDPMVVNQFRQWTKSAESLAEARLRRDPKDVEALYFLGATEGLKAVFAAAVERRFTAALRNSTDAVERHRQVLKLDPTFHDAELTIGMQDYIIGSLPLPLKLLAGISGVRGSRKRGLETLERVAREGHWASDMARLLLVDIYKREKSWSDAIAVSRELAVKYPHNYFFRLQTADALIAQAASQRQLKDGDAAQPEQEAFNLFESLLKDKTAKSAADLIHFRYGEAYMLAGKPAQAVAQFQAVAQTVDAEPALVALARQRAAQATESSGKHR
jgi:tetratricopeptide (TPR) repeat protein